MCKLPDKIQPQNREQLKQLINYAFKHKQYDLNFTAATSQSEEFKVVFKYSNFDFEFLDTAEEIKTPDIII